MNHLALATARRTMRVEKPHRWLWTKHFSYTWLPHDVTTILFSNTSSHLLQKTVFSSVISQQILKHLISQEPAHMEANCLMYPFSCIPPSFSLYHFVPPCRQNSTILWPEFILILLLVLSENYLYISPACWACLYVVCKEISCFCSNCTECVLYPHKDILTKCKS